jgi:16S rRNA (cytidine1402-2'-O)-methyltransferase
MEKEIFDKGMVYVFIEAPYRNDKLLKQLILSLKDQAILCAAVDLTMETQEVITMPISRWKQENVERFHKRQVVFVLGKVR